MSQYRDSARRIVRALVQIGKDLAESGSCPPDEMDEVRQRCKDDQEEYTQRITRFLIAETAAIAYRRHYKVNADEDASIADHEEADEALNRALADFDREYPHP